MNKKLRLLLIVILSLTLLISCEEENLINGGSKSTSTTVTSTTGTTTTGTTTSSKCYVKDITEVIGKNTYKTQFTYNTKNLLEKANNDGAITTYDYDASSRVTKQTVVNGTATETYSYTYDSKGNITNIKYVAKNTPIDIFVKEYIITSNTSGQITKVIAVTEDVNVDFLFEYDSKSNVKKLIVSVNGKKETLIENVMFDDKSNAFLNANLAKVNIPFVIVGAFFGENLTYFMNNNNVLTDKIVGVFTPEVATTTYKYEYTKEGFSSKMTNVKIIGKDQETGVNTYTYNSK